MRWVRAVRKATAELAASQAVRARESQGSAELAGRQPAAVFGSGTEEQGSGPVETQVGSDLIDEIPTSERISGGPPSFLGRLKWGIHAAWRIAGDKDALKALTLFVDGRLEEAIKELSVGGYYLRYSESPEELTAVFWAEGGLRGTSDRVRVMVEGRYLPLGQVRGSAEWYDYSSSATVRKGLGLAGFIAGPVAKVGLRLESANGVGSALIAGIGYYLLQMNLSEFTWSQPSSAESSGSGWDVYRGYGSAPGWEVWWVLFDESDSSWFDFEVGVGYQLLRFREVRDAVSGRPWATAAYGPLMVNLSGVVVALGVNWYF